MESWINFLVTEIGGIDISMIVCGSRSCPRSDFATELEVWSSLIAAECISADGKTIVGGGVNFLGEQEAFIATIHSVPVRGDANGDGSFDFSDIEAFFLAITDLPAYTAHYPKVAVSQLDMNADGNTDFGDIEAFFTAVTGG